MKRTKSSEPSKSGSLTVQMKSNPVAVVPQSAALQSTGSASPHQGPQPVRDSNGDVIIDNVYVLNRKIRTDRIEVMLPMLHHVGIYPQVWEAYELPEDPTKGCLYSHKNIMRDIFIHNYKWALILEDDVDFDVTFRDQLADLMHNRVKEGVDLVYLGVVNEEAIITGHNSTKTIFKKASKPRLVFD